MVFPFMCVYVYFGKQNLTLAVFRCSERDENIFHVGWKLGKVVDTHAAID